MATPASFDARSRLHDPGYTPSAAHLPALFALLAGADKAEAPRIERVIARAGDAALQFALEAIGRTSGEARARVAAVLGRLADPRAAAVLRQVLEDAEPRVRRRAASALGRLPPDSDSERALAAALERAALSEQRVIAEALGKVGGETARKVLAALPTGDPELARRVRNALLLLDRRGTRDQASGIVTDRPLARPARLLVRCRAGLAELLASELAPIGAPRVVSEQLVELEHAGPLSALFCARIALEWGVAVELSRDRALPSAVATALAGPDAARALSAWSDAAPRYRLEFARGGHQRARVFEIAAEVKRRLPALVNDPRKASWTFVIVDDVPEPHLVLVPQGFDDPRFLYRTREVRAGSHPSVAAALARAAGVRRDDRVWDPFVGSGLELVERGLLGPYAKLVGSDRDPDALSAARENLDAAGVTAELREGDATRLDPGPQTLIITNPPMGRRLVRDATLGSLLERFVDNAARVLAPGGRMVWLSPLPELTRARARSRGLRAPTGQLVDMGGFQAELQVFFR